MILGSSIRASRGQLPDSRLKILAAKEGVQRAPESRTESSAVAAQPAATQDRYIVFLFDDRHLNLSDLAITQRAATKMLDDPLGAGEYADVLSFMGVNSGGLVLDLPFLAVEFARNDPGRVAL